MQVGQVWAYRERVSDPTSPLVPAEILQFGPPKTQKARVRWQAGEYPGLDEWVTKRRLVVLWNEAEAWLRDEQAFALARQASNDADPIEHRAAWEVLYVYPMPDGILLEGIEARDGSTVDVADFDAVCTDLNLDWQELLRAPFAFLDRHGHYIAPWPVARQLARVVAARYADLGLAHVAQEERELQDRAIHGYSFKWSRNDPEHFVPPERCIAELREMEPVFALVRKWCGVEAVEHFDQLAGLRQEVVRLRGLIEKAAARIREAGHPRVATNLLNEMNRLPLETDSRRRRQSKGD